MSMSMTIVDGGLMVMDSWLWWDGQKLCGIVDQSLDALYSSLLKL